MVIKGVRDGGKAKMVSWSLLFLPLFPFNAKWSGEANELEMERM